MKPVEDSSDIPQESITDQDYIEAANKIGCEVEVIKAVAGVESGGSGFWKSGELKILFEPHIFWRQLVKRGIDPNQMLHDHPGHEDVLYLKWKTFPYPPIDKRWAELAKAAEIHAEAAYESASYGKFQILGLHHTTCGYADVFMFVNNMRKGERYHLQAFVTFIMNTGLYVWLKKKDFTMFAKLYNGPGYKNSPTTIKDDYDYLLKTEYDRLCLLRNQ